MSMLRGRAVHKRPCGGRTSARGSFWVADGSWDARRIDGQDDTGWPGLEMML